MELSRRGVIGGLGAACAVGVVGLVGASTVDDPLADDADDTEEEESRYVAVDPDAPFVARLDDGSTGTTLFDAADLSHVEGVYPSGDDHVVALELTDDGRDALRSTLEDEGATDDPEPFAIEMTLDGDPVREIDLDEATVDALAGDDFDGVVTLSFDDADVAETLYDSLAGE
ncbi:twin-arginine translocation signal domain-containing protein [Halorubrum sp. JWXQ-INN 858]|uniref:twin-arginine translocation signal domain-containing protein n=1 Tax=Halorubrum sp. JWXQ-INN 858 TaxID=2690782 RepID=UPI00135829FD|nr:twin-arginine translocation signal domain-containing protein [Halorubrum sp. JWXQ-INN 858]MWV63233.1 twin-arginine translocation signal domain-containing protein [Halorubrum sp. JWXQ-INN 858]